MSILSSIFGGGVAEPIEALGNVFDKLFTSGEERLKAEAVLEKLKQHPAELQVELNKIEASHRSIFVAGWRPAIGWVCAAALANVFLVNPWLVWITGKPGPYIGSNLLIDLVLAMLGMGALRTAEKFGGKTK